MIDKIEQMVANKEITKQSDGWKKLTDTLRAKLVCSHATEILNTLETLQNSSNVKLMRMKLKFCKSTNKNEIIINFDYKGQMICEFCIKLVTLKVPLL